MADITVTASSVAKGTDAVLKTVIARVAITAGQSVVLDSTDTQGRYRLADADTAATAGCGGVALDGGAADQPVTIITRGNYNPGGTVVAGTPYCVSTNAGGIAPFSDLGQGDYVTLVGMATSTSNVKVQILASGVAIA